MAPLALVKDLSVGERQRVEILKALYRNATVLILDEPTAVLVPQEVDRLFESLRRLQAAGLSVVFISHKLVEVMSITDQVTVLRAGEVVGTVNTADTSQSELARLMVGRETFAASRLDRSSAIGPISSEVVDSTRLDRSPKIGPIEIPTLRLENVAAQDNKGLSALKNITLDVHAGEIVGLAGVSGNGQSELAQVLEGVRQASAGRVLVDGQDLTHADPTGMMRAGVGRIPEDRHESVVPEMTVAQNMALEHLGEFVAKGTLDKRRMRQTRRAPDRRVPDQGQARRPHPHPVRRQHAEGDPGAGVGAQPQGDRGGPAHARPGRGRHRVRAWQACRAAPDAARPFCSSPRTWTRFWSCPTASP